MAAAALPAAGPSAKPINPTELSYAEAYLVESARRMLFISGQVPSDNEGVVPEGFDAQCRLAWGNVMVRLQAAGMTLTDLVKVTVFLADRQDRQANTAIRHEVLRGHAPAITVVIAEIFDEAWLLEIEAVAAQ